MVRIRNILVDGDGQSLVRDEMKPGGEGPKMGRALYLKGNEVG